MNEKIREIVSEIKKYLKKKYGNSIKWVILYGSYARGEVHPDSDIDILVVVDEHINTVEVEESLNDLLFDILINYKELCSVIAVHEKLFKEYDSPFFLNVKKEGIFV